mmetsp:Transcript_54294/g.133076  ORF Transcript_54294/g.133076 Transcript_54294/m.133076 type:complete len:259 (-) Transcript_54294:856-1632(-)
MPGTGGTGLRDAAAFTSSWSETPFFTASTRRSVGRRGLSRPPLPLTAFDSCDNDRCAPSALPSSPPPSAVATVASVVAEVDSLLMPTLPVLPRLRSDGLPMMPLCPAASATTARGDVGFVGALDAAGVEEAAALVVVVAVVADVLLVAPPAAAAGLLPLAALRALPLTIITSPLALRVIVLPRVRPPTFVRCAIMHAAHSCRFDLLPPTPPPLIVAAVRLLLLVDAVTAPHRVHLSSDDGGYNDSTTASRSSFSCGTR